MFNTVKSKLVFDPDFHTELIIKDEIEDSGNQRTRRSKVGFPCIKCEYAATRDFILKIHIENQHEEVKYPCSQCELSEKTQ